MELPALIWKVAWAIGAGSLCSWLHVENWPSSKTPWVCPASELRRAVETHVHCGEGAPLLPNQLWLIGLKADLNTVDFNGLKNLPKVPSKVLLGLLEERERRGEFCDWEEVARLPGIGPVRLNSLKDHLFIQCRTER